MIIAAQYARENKIPFFGICLGMQICVIEYARNVLGLKDADSTEMNQNTGCPVIALMSDKAGTEVPGGLMGGTLRLGKYECSLADTSLAQKAYGEKKIWERHRHRYEFNNDFKDRFEKAGLKFSGINEERGLVEIAELDTTTHPWMLAVQFHPEFKSRPNRAHPLFRDFIGAALQQTERR